MCCNYWEVLYFGKVLVLFIFLSQWAPETFIQETPRCSFLRRTCSISLARVVKHNGKNNSRNENIYEHHTKIAAKNGSKHRNIKVPTTTKMKANVKHQKQVATKMKPNMNK